eukprot:Sspe_Gene.86110::Locus_56839_Transcript_5_10_Confidence_0.214_Length_1115::g.86110::m.86110
MVGEDGVVSARNSSVEESAGLRAEEAGQLCADTLHLQGEDHRELVATPLDPPCLFCGGHLQTAQPLPHAHVGVGVLFLNFDKQSGQQNGPLALLTHLRLQTRLKDRSTLRRGRGRAVAKNPQEDPNHLQQVIQFHPPGLGGTAEVEGARDEGVGSSHNAGEDKAVGREGSDGEPRLSREPAEEHHCGTPDPRGAEGSPQHPHVPREGHRGLLDRDVHSIRRAHTVSVHGGICSTLLADAFGHRVEPHGKVRWVLGRGGGRWCEVGGTAAGIQLPRRRLVSSVVLDCRRESAFHAHIESVWKGVCPMKYRDCFRLLLFLFLLLWGVPTMSRDCYRF